MNEMRKFDNYLHPKVSVVTMQWHPSKLVGQTPALGSDEHNVLGARTPTAHELQYTLYFIISCNIIWCAFK